MLELVAPCLKVLRDHDSKLIMRLEALEEIERKSKSSSATSTTMTTSPVELWDPAIALLTLDVQVLACSCARALLSGTSHSSSTSIATATTTIVTGVGTHMQVPGGSEVELELALALLEPLAIGGFGRAEVARVILARKDISQDTLQEFLDRHLAADSIRFDSARVGVEHKRLLAQVVEVREKLLYR